MEKTEKNNFKCKPNPYVKVERLTSYSLDVYSSKYIKEKELTKSAGSQPPRSVTPGEAQTILIDDVCSMAPEKESVKRTLVAAVENFDTGKISDGDDNDYCNESDDDTVTFNFESDEDALPDLEDPQPNSKRVSSGSDKFESKTKRIRSSQSPTSKDCVQVLCSSSSD